MTIITLKKCWSLKFVCDVFIIVLLCDLVITVSRDNLFHGPPFVTLPLTEPCLFPVAAHTAPRGPFSFNYSLFSSASPSGDVQPHGRFSPASNKRCRIPVCCYSGSRLVYKAGLHRGNPGLQPFIRVPNTQTHTLPFFHLDFPFLINIYCICWCLLKVH